MHQSVTVVVVHSRTEDEVLSDAYPEIHRILQAGARSAVVGFALGAGRADIIAHRASLTSRRSHALLPMLYTVPVQMEGF